MTNLLTLVVVKAMKKMNNKKNYIIQLYNYIYQGVKMIQKDIIKVVSQVQKDLVTARIQ